MPSAFEEGLGMVIALKYEQLVFAISNFYFRGTLTGDNLLPR
jgi:hypothetical protein